MEYPYYAFSQIFGSFIVEAEYAKELGKYLFYDDKKDVFLDKDGNVVDITGYDIFPRTGALDAEKIVEKTTTNMIQKTSPIFAVKPLISKEI